MIDLTDVQESIRNMTSAEQWLEKLSTRNNHSEAEIGKMDYPHISQKIVDKLAMPNYSYLLWFDFTVLYERLHDTVTKVPAEQSSAVELIEKKFEENWKSK